MPRGGAEPVVLVGGGLAAAKAAEALRDGGHDGAVVLVTEEAEPPYERPPLSKAVLRGEAPDDSTRALAADWWDAHGVELLTGTAAVRLDPAAQEVETADGRVVPFSAALLATGAEPRRLPVPGGDLPGVMVLRSLADARALRERLVPGTRLVVVGAGWIGCEVAASARQRGVEVTVVEPLAVPLQRVLGEEVGAVFRDLHAEHGVDLRLGVGVSALVGDGAVRGVATTAGDEVAADVVLVGVGVTPRTGLAEAAGLTVDDGVVVDAHLRTSHERVLAAGDVASAWSPFYGRHLRVEHWANALNQGPAAARTMLGSGEPYTRLPYFFSDQYDLGLEYLGDARRWDDLVVRGSLADRRFVGFYREGGRVVAAIAVNTWDTVDALRALITSRERVDVARLADEGVALEDLVEPAA